MTQGYCTDKAALIGFVYDDCERGERDRIAAHVADCADCTAELASLSATRRQLAAWVPPQAALGFQIDPAQMAESLNAGPEFQKADTARAPFSIIDGGNADAGRPARPVAPWWKQPLPAWAQAAAAVLIFAAGVGFGAGKSAGNDVGNISGSSGETGITAVRQAAPASSPEGVRSTPVVATTAPAVSTEELARVEQKLRAMQAEIAAIRAASRPAGGSGSGSGSDSAAADNRVTLAQVQDLVTTSEVKMHSQVLVLDNAFQRYVERVASFFTPAQRARFQEIYQVEPAAALNSGGRTIGLQPVSYQPTR